MVVLSAKPHAHKFQLLDAMRGVAAIFVAQIHSQIIFFNSVQFQESYLAVDLFFCLSGFVIAHAYEKRLIDQINLGQFVLIRLVRLYPLYILATLFGAILHVYYLHHGSSTEGMTLPTLCVSLFFAIFMLPVFGQNALYPLDSPAWSLLFELVANVVYAIMVIHRAAGTKTLVTIAAGSTIGLIACGLVSSHGLNLGVGGRGSLGALPRVGYSFAAGVILFRLWSAREAQSRQGFDLVKSAILLMVLIMSFILHPPEKWHFIYDFIVVTFVFPVIVYCAATVTVNSLFHAIFSFLGAISYALYIIHVEVFEIIKILAHQVSWIYSQSPNAFDIVSVIILCIIAPFLDAYYDLPVRRWAANLGRRLSTTTVVRGEIAEATQKS